MKDYKWFQNVIKEYEDDFEFMLEDKKLDITEEIYQAMNENGFNKKDLAEKLGTTPAAITKLLDGNSNFTLKTLLRLSIILNRSLSVAFQKPSTSVESISKYIKSALETTTKKVDTQSDMFFLSASGTCRTSDCGTV